MVGLRAKQKADKNRRIVEAASKLIREVGYDAARIEDIAERAEVSVGTFYNYYQNKGDILLAIVSMEVEEMVGTGKGIVANPPPSVFDALNKLIHLYYEHSLVYLSKEMWRIAMATAMRHPDTPFGQRYVDLDRALCSQVAALLAALQQRGVVTVGIDTNAVGRMFFNNLNMMFTEFVRDEAMSLDWLSNEIARQNRPLATLISSPGQ